MQSTAQITKPNIIPLHMKDVPNHIHAVITQAWQTIAPTWPLKNIIACNPLQGFEDLPFEEATARGALGRRRGRLEHRERGGGARVPKLLQRCCKLGSRADPQPQCRG